MTDDGRYIYLNPNSFAFPKFPGGPSDRASGSSSGRRPGGNMRFDPNEHPRGPGGKFRTVLAFVGAIKTEPLKFKDHDWGQTDRDLSLGHFAKWMPKNTDWKGDESHWNLLMNGEDYQQTRKVQDLDAKLRGNKSWHEMVSSKQFADLMNDGKARSTDGDHQATNDSQRALHRMLYTGHSTSPVQRSFAGALQRVVQESFGLPRWLPKDAVAFGSGSPTQDQVYRRNRSGIFQLVKTVYQSTQSILKDEKISHLGVMSEKLYYPQSAKSSYDSVYQSGRLLRSEPSGRILYPKGFKPGVGSGTFHLPPVDHSFSTNIDSKRDDFESHIMTNASGSYIWGKVPAARVLSTGRTGFGEFYNRDVSVLGNLFKGRTFSWTQKWMKDLADKHSDGDEYETYDRIMRQLFHNYYTYKD